MNKKEKTANLEKFIELSASWLLKPEAEIQYNYLLSRVPENKFKQFKFGYMPSSTEALTMFSDEYGCMTKSDPVKTLIDCNLIYLTDKYNKITSALKYHQLLVPFYDMYGCPIAIAGRTLLSEDDRNEKNISKYKNTPFEKRRHLYGLNCSYKNIIKKNYAVVVEGQFDFISGFINGIDNIVALGGSKLSFEHIALLKRFTNNFYMLLDNDEAGQHGFEKINKSASKYDIKINKIILPDEFKDLDEFLKVNKIHDIRDLK
ncbi:MAG: toprim domain-containing protein [Bacteroidia bacterium]